MFRAMQEQLNKLDNPMNPLDGTRRIHMIDKEKQVACDSRTHSANPQDSVKQGQQPCGFHAKHLRSRPPKPFIDNLIPMLTD